MNATPSIEFPVGFPSALLPRPTGQVVLRLIAMLVGPLLALSRGEGAQSKGDDLFADARITRIHLEIRTNDLPALRNLKLTGRMGRPQFTIAVQEGNRTYPGVTMHLKGSFGSFRTIDHKPAFTLDFDDRDEKQRFHGLKKIHLNNSVQDPTYLSEKFSRELFYQIGVPCPRVGYATVSVNGKDMGLYLLVESYGRQFLSRHFKDTTGNLYDIPNGEELDLNGKHPVNSGDQPKDQRELRGLVEAISPGDYNERMRRMRRVLDLDRFVKHVALDVLLQNWDGYAWGQNNYRIFNDKSAGHLVFMPHGLDQTFQQAAAPITPRMSGAVAAALLEMPDGLQLYLSELSKVLAQVSPASAMTNRLRTLAGFIRPELERRDQELASKFDSDVNEYCDRVVQRVAMVDAQLKEASEPVQFDEHGELAVGGFKEWSEFGRPVVARDPQARSQLRIAAINGPAIAWWSRKVWLPQGRYRFEGRLKTSGVEIQPGDTAGGAGIRIAGHRLRNGLKGDREWTSQSFEFEITDALFPMELVCELRGASGEAVFDEASLRVVRR